MPNNSNDRLEREALESLVAADLSAKMKQWRNSDPPPEKGKGWLLPLLLLLLAFGGAAWLFWPKAAKTDAPLPEKPVQQSNPDTTAPKTPTQQLPVAQKPIPSPNRYLALAQSSYRAPNFVDEIRGNGSEAQQVLNRARQALADRQYQEALRVLQDAPPEYQADAAYLRGHALFGQKKYPQAAAIFGQLGGSVRYGDAAQWFEILSLLPEFEQNKSLIVKKLKKISEDSGHTFQIEAKQLGAQI
jgi:TolA-binding protein